MLSNESIKYHKENTYYNKLCINSERNIEM